MNEHKIESRLRIMCVERVRNTVFRDRCVAAATRVRIAVDRSRQCILVSGALCLFGLHYLLLTFLKNKILLCIRMKQLTHPKRFR